MIIDHSMNELKSECINNNLIDLVINRLPWMQLVLFPLSFWFLWPFLKII